MYFLKWLYREANPMALVLVLALLWLLLNTVFGFNSRPDADVETLVTDTVKETVHTDADAEKAVEIASNTQATAEQSVAISTGGTETTPASDKNGTNEVRLEIIDETAESSREETADKRGSIFSNIFKGKPDPVVAVAPVTAETAPVEVTQAVEETTQQEVLTEPPATVVEDADVAETVAEIEQASSTAEITAPEEEPKKSGGFLGLFGGQDKSDKENKQDTATNTQTENDENAAVAEAANSESTNADVALVEKDSQAAVTSSGVEESLPPAPPGQNVSANVNKLADARRAFWNREYAQADTLYRELIGQEASNAELISEYGNMLLQSGQVEKTLDAYERAAAIFIDGDRKQDAKPLIDYIASWDKERAEKLINKVFNQ